MMDNLWYSKCNGGKNVGDLVGKYLYEKITKKDFNYIHPTKTKEPVHLACGSVIQQKHIKNNNTIIWGSGIMFPKSLNKFQSEVHAVRGKKTQEVLKALNLNCPSVYGDPALLLPKFFNPTTDKEYDIGLILHYSHSNLIDPWAQKLKSRYSVNVINPSLDVESFILEIKKCKYTISSSLHGVVFSHAYGVESLPIHLNKFGLNGSFFKFEDYYSLYDINHKAIFKKDIFNKPDVVENIKLYPQPEFPIDVDKLLDVCPYLKESK